jgi:parallel beta-helix repeat protein
LIGNLIANNNNGILLRDLGANLVVNNTIINNKLVGLYHYRCYGTQLKNNIHWNNNNEFIFDNGFSVQNCLIQDSALVKGLVDLGENIFNIYPMFKDTLNYDYSLLHSSIGINTGTNDTTGLKIPVMDIESNYRISNGRIDIGAYEFQDNSDFVRILKPYYHEYLVSNLYYDLKWNLNDSLSSVKLIFSPDKGATWQTITASTPNDGIYTWKVPEIFADSCLWAVVDLAKPMVGDTSRYYYTISPNIIPDGCKVYGTLKAEFSPYHVLGKLIVPKDSLLSIEPGTVVKMKTGEDFDEYYYDNDGVDIATILIYGRINASGKKENPILFTGTNKNEKWGVIVLDEFSKKGSKFDYCTFENSNKYWFTLDHYVYNYESALNIESDSAVISNSIIQNSNSGIYVSHRGNGNIVKNCVIKNNDSHGINGYSGEVINCTIAGNNGIGVSGAFSIKNTILYNNQISLAYRKTFDTGTSISFSLVEEKQLTAE